MAFTCLDVVKAAELEAGPISGTEHSFKCSRHPDKHPSLKINKKKNCWMCGPCSAKGNAWALAAFIAGVSPDDKPAVTQWLRDRGLLNSASIKKRIVATYNYCDQDGNLIFQTVRYEPKDFRQRRPNGNGGWIWDLDGITLVPYRLNEWKESACIYIVEGEKDADNVWKFNLPATTSPMGAEKWRIGYNHWFTGKDVVLIGDNDKSGEEHIKQVARQLFPVAKSIKIIRLPDLSPKGDVSDWIDAGGTKAQFENIVSLAPVLTSSEIDAWESPHEEQSQIPGNFHYESALHIPAVHEIPKVDVEYIVQGFIPRKSVVIIAAPSGGMKSYLALDIGHRVSCGEPFAGRKTRKIPVLYLDRENPDVVIRERINFLGIHRNVDFHYWGLWLLEGPPLLNDPRIISFAKDYQGLIIVDSLIRFSSAADENDATEMSHVMNALRYLQSLGATVMVMHHASEKSAFSYRGSSEIRNSSASK